jgi:hypothetical protein
MTNQIDRIANATRMPTDMGGNPIPALMLYDDKAHHLTAGETSSTNTVPFNDNTSVIALYVSGDDGIYIQFGDSTVTATSSSHFFPAGIYYNFALHEQITHVAVLRAGSTDQTVHISECH